MQWWGALTHQFQSIAASALKEVSDRHPLDAGKGMAQDVIKTVHKSAVKPAAKAPVKAKPKAKAKSKAPARATAAAARKSPSRAR
jgi:hypothetical protein